MTIYRFSNPVYLHFQPRYLFVSRLPFHILYKDKQNKYVSSNLLVHDFTINSPDFSFDEFKDSINMINDHLVENKAKSLFVQSVDDAGFSLVWSGRVFPNLLNNVAVRTSSEPHLSVHYSIKHALEQAVSFMAVSSINNL